MLKPRNLTRSKRIETYTGTTDANGLITVTYPRAFATVPHVHPGPVSSSDMVWVLVSSTVNGFSIRLVQRGVVTLLTVQVLLGTVTNVAGSAESVKCWWWSGSVQSSTVDAVPVRPALNVLVSPGEDFRI